MLGKLSRKTGREWTLNDIMKLAEKMPKGGGNIDSVLNELSDMGLDVPEETKEKVKDHMKSGKSLTMDDIGKLMPTDVKAKTSKTRTKKPTRAVGKSKHLSLAERVKKLSGKGKKKR
ncbi:hypothetical protein [Brevibacillus reuszeri]|uniref:hypothetical protein n=1 Tax=Brevibacillus reuszeri TaxID=54915 RepID=UPI001F2A551D|nr:hypothetical protein [Brevibacillus reuszeri]